MRSALVCVVSSSSSLNRRRMMSESHPMSTTSGTGMYESTLAAASAANSASAIQPHQQQLMQQQHSASLQQLHQMQQPINSSSMQSLASLPMSGYPTTASVATMPTHLQQQQSSSPQNPFNQAGQLAQYQHQQAAMMRQANLLTPGTVSMTTTPATTIQSGPMTTTAAPSIKPESAKTELKIHPAVRMFESWHRAHPQYGPTFQPLAQLQISTLLYLIGDWIMSVHKAHGGTYTADTLYVYLSSIQRHIRVSQNAPTFNLLDSDQVRTAMEKKFGQTEIATILNRGQNASQKMMQLNERTQMIDPLKRKRPREEGNMATAATAAAASVIPPYMYSHGHPQLFALASGDVLAFKPPKPSHSHRSFHTEQRLLHARQDPSTPEGLLRCFLHIVLRHAISLSRTACWNLTINQFSIIQAPTNLGEDKKDELFGRRYLQFQPTRKREQVNAYRHTEPPQPVIMFEQPSAPHLCPVFLFTELMKHRPPLKLQDKSHPRILAADVSLAPESLARDFSYLWLLTKKTIDGVGEFAGVWYANRRIGLGTMEKLISVVKNTMNEPPPTTGDALAERAAKLLSEDTSAEMDEGGEGGDGDEEDEDGNEAGGGGKRQRLKAPTTSSIAAQVQAAQNQATINAALGLPSNFPPFLTPSNMSAWPPQAAAAAAAAAQRAGKKPTTATSATSSSTVASSTAGGADTAQQRQLQQITSSLNFAGLPFSLPTQFPGGGSPTVPGVLPPPGPLDIHSPEFQTYLQYVNEHVRKMRAGVEKMEQGLEDLTKFVKASSTTTTNTTSAAANAPASPNANANTYQG